MHPWVTNNYRSKPSWGPCVWVGSSKVSYTGTNLAVGDRSVYFVTFRKNRSCPGQEGVILNIDSGVGIRAWLV